VSLNVYALVGINAYLWYRAINIIFWQTDFWLLKSGFIPLIIFYWPS